MATRAVALIPGRRRGSLWATRSARSKFLGGGQVEKSILARALMSLTVPVNSLSGTASTRTTAVWPRLSCPRSASSTRAATRTALRSGSSTRGAPGQTRSPSLNSGALAPKKRPRQLGRIVTMPSTGALSVIDSMPRCALWTSKSALARFCFLLSMSAAAAARPERSFCSASRARCSAVARRSFVFPASMADRISCFWTSSRARSTS